MKSRAYMVIVGLVLTLALAVPALADTLTLNDYTLGYKTKISYMSHREWVYTAEMDVSLQGGFDGTGYCVDPSQYIWKGSFNEYEFMAPSQANATNTDAILTPGGGLLATWLLQEYAPGLGHNGPYGERVEITALQLAIWEMITDEVWDLGSGNFLFYKAHANSEVNRQILERVNFFLSNLPSSFTPEQTARLDARNKIAASPRHQDLAVGASATPEPASLLLVTPALVGAIVLRRRRDS